MLSADASYLVSWESTCSLTSGLGSGIILECFAAALTDLGRNGFADSLAGLFGSCGLGRG